MSYFSRFRRPFGAEKIFLCLESSNKWHILNSDDEIQFLGHLVAGHLEHMSHLRKPSAVQSRAITQIIDQNRLKLTYLCDRMLLQRPQRAVGGTCIGMDLRPLNIFWGRFSWWRRRGRGNTLAPLPGTNSLRFCYSKKNEKLLAAAASRSPSPAVDHSIDC